MRHIDIGQRPFVTLIISATICMLEISIIVYPRLHKQFIKKVKCAARAPFTAGTAREAVASPAAARPPATKRVKWRQRSPPRFDGKMSGALQISSRWKFFNIPDSSACWSRVGSSVHARLHPVWIQICSTFWRSKSWIQHGSRLRTTFGRQIVCVIWMYSGNTVCLFRFSGYTNQVKFLCIRWQYENPFYYVFYNKSTARRTRVYMQWHQKFCNCN